MTDITRYTLQVECSKKWDITYDLLKGDSNIFSLEIVSRGGCQKEIPCRMCEHLRMTEVVVDA